VKRSTERGVAVLAVGILAIGCAQPDGSGDGEASSNEGGTGTGTSDGTSESGPGGDLPPADPEPCEGIAGPVEPIENLPDAHGWQPSDGPECPGEPVQIVPPCWDGTCFEGVTCTACAVRVWNHASSETVELRLAERRLGRYQPAAGSWEEILTGLDFGPFPAIGKSGIVEVVQIDGIGPTELRRVAPDSGAWQGVGWLAGGLALGLPALNDGSSLTFAAVDSSDNYLLCRADSADWQPKAVASRPIPTVTTYWATPSAEVYDDWIYWANERVHVDSGERQVLFERELEWRPAGFTVIDDDLWFLNAHPCDGETGECCCGDGGLFRVGFEGPAADYPEMMGVAAHVYADPTFAWLATDGVRLYWQRRDYNAGPQGGPAEFVAFDPQTEQLEVLFEFEPGDELTSYRVVGEHLYGVRKQAPGCLERLSLVP
jgi:hypothetical protein